MLDDDGKIVPPMSFIPILERTGMIIKLDFCVLEQVCALIRKWIDEEHDEFQPLVQDEVQEGSFQ